MIPPGKDEYAEFYHGYVAAMSGKDVLKTMSEQPEELRRLLSGVSDETANRGYAEGKWSIKELLGHIIDTERVFVYRLLRFCRGDETPLSGFDQDPYVAAGRANERSLESLIEEFEHLRRANMFLIGNLAEADLERSGTASGNSVTVRALVCITGGHTQHHMNILKERYL